MFAIHYPAGPGKRNLLARQPDGCHEWAEAKPMTFATETEARGYGRRLPWLGKLFDAGHVQVVAAPGQVHG